MTREEAREYFKHHMRFYCVTGVCREAEEMAIKALEQGSCDECEVGNPCLYCKHEFEPQESEDFNV